MHVLQQGYSENMRRIGEADGEAVYQDCSCEVSASIGPDQPGEHRNDAALRVILVPEVSSA